MTSLRRGIRERLQLDRSLGYALATRGWQALSGPVTIVLLIRSLTLAEQGVYYAFVGIVSIQAYFELGLLNVLVSYAGHESAAMNVAAKDDREGMPSPEWTKAASCMRDLIRASFRWFSAASLLFAFAATAFGWLTLDGSDVAWQGPLILLAPIAAVSVALAPGLAILEGAGYREQIYRYRFLQMVLGSLSVWTALLVGLKLYSLVIAATLQTAIGLYVVFGCKAGFFARYRSLPLSASHFSWVRDVLPLQWRMSLITAAFHFATQFLTVIVVWFHTDVAAAPLGMTLSITTAIQMLALAWVQTKYPLIAQLHGADQREQAGTLWRKTTLISSTLLIVAFAAFIVLIVAIPLFEPQLERRFVPPWQLALLSVGCLANHLTAVQGFYVLARRAAPLLRPSLIGAAAVATGVWLGGYHHAASGVIIGYTLGMTLVLLPLHTLAYFHFRRESANDSSC